jgi:hypothetical protein
MVFLYCAALALAILNIIRYFGRKPAYAFGTERQSLAFLSLTVPLPISVLLGYILGNLTDSNSFALRYEQYLLPVIYVPLAIVVLIAIDRVKVLGKWGFLVIALASALFLAPQTAIKSYEFPLSRGVKPQVEWLYENKALFDDTTAIVFYRLYNDSFLDVLKEMYFEGHDDWEIPLSNIITTTPNATEELSAYIEERHPRTIALCGQYDFTGALTDYILKIDDPMLYISVWERQ